MKRIILVLSCLLMATFVQAQDSLKRVKPGDGDWGLTFYMNGLIQNLKLDGHKDPEGNPMILVRKYIKDDLALRVGFGFNGSTRKTTHKDSLPSPPSFVEFDSTYSQRTFSLTTGIEKHIGKMRRLDPYIGAELRWRFIGNEHITWNELITESTGTTTIEGDYKKEGGFGLGVIGIAGFNYFVTKNISVGAEYYFGYDYLRTGGNVSESETTTPITGSSVTSYSRRTEQESASTFAVSNTAQIMLSIFF